MDLTQGTFKEKKNRAKKMMLWFGIVSLVMSFAGLTSAYIVSSKRPDWLKDYELPSAFTMSLVVIIISSITFYWAKRALKKQDRNMTTVMLLATFGLGVFFMVSQFNGFSQLVASGYYFTGGSSQVTVSYVYLIAIVHIFHVVAGLISILVVLFKHSKNSYSSSDYLGLELSETFWHFVDILWIFLFLFLSFY